MTISMMPRDEPDAGLMPLAEAFSRRDRLSPRERALLLDLPRRYRSFRRGEQIVAENSRPTESCLLLRGFAARVTLLGSGHQQITALQVPGDFIDLHAFLLKVLDHGIVALSPCQVAFVPHGALLALMERSAHLGRLLWLSTVVDGAIQRAWLASLGRRSSVERLAHLICETYERLKVVDLARDCIFEFPAAQSQLSDMLGISTVHVNRCLQELRGTGLMSWANGRVEIQDFEKLAAFGYFDACYLNLLHEPR